MNNLWKILTLALLFTSAVSAQNTKEVTLTDSVYLNMDSIASLSTSEKTKTSIKKTAIPEEKDTVKFNPDPMRAVWYAALMPGLGQIYNRRYWKLPIIIGGYMGLTYATTWNNKYYKDYSTAYRDIMDNDPSTNSYMNFLKANTDETTLDKNWLKTSLKQKKDFYRRNRDLCIISMVGLYLVSMVDAYVDAQLFHFDISPDLSFRVNPAILEPAPFSTMSMGLQCAITF